jgi:hypothetical protein
MELLFPLLLLVLLGVPVLLVVSWQRRRPNVPTHGAFPTESYGAASWQRDPSGRFEHRWWDGYQWTAHVSTGGVAFTDPVPNQGHPGGGPLQ